MDTTTNIIRLAKEADEKLRGVTNTTSHEQTIAILGPLADALDAEAAKSVDCMPGQPSSGPTISTAPNNTIATADPAVSDGEPSARRLLLAILLLLAANCTAPPLLVACSTPLVVIFLMTPFFVTLASSMRERRDPLPSLEIAIGHLDAHRKEFVSMSTVLDTCDALLRATGSIVGKHAWNDEAAFNRAFLSHADRGELDGADYTVRYATCQQNGGLIVVLKFNETVGQSSAMLNVPADAVEFKCREGRPTVSTTVASAEATSSSDNARDSDLLRVVMRVFKDSDTGQTRLRVMTAFCEARVEDSALPTYPSDACEAFKLTPEPHPVLRGLRTGASYKFLLNSPPPVMASFVRRSLAAWLIPKAETGLLPKALTAS